MGFRVFDAERLHEHQLEGFRCFIGETLIAVDDGYLVIFEMFKIVEGVEDASGAIAEIGGGAHAVEEQRKIGSGFFDGELVGSMRLRRV